MKSPTAPAELDVRGLSCPMPLLKTHQRMRAMNAGEVIHVLSDDPVSLHDIPAWCHKMGHVLVETKRLTEGVAFTIQHHA